jgi:hypothetical protein
MARKRHTRGGKAKGLHARKIEDLHFQMDVKDLQQWKRKLAGRADARVYRSPAKPKLQAKENFLVSHMSLRGEG